MLIVDASISVGLVNFPLEKDSYLKNEKVNGCTETPLPASAAFESEGEELFDFKIQDLV